MRARRMESTKHINVFKACNTHVLSCFFFFLKLTLTLLLLAFCHLAIARQLGDSSKIKIRVGSEGDESWSSEWSRAGDQDTKARTEAGEGESRITFGKGQCRAGAGTRGWWQKRGLLVYKNPGRCVLCMNQNTSKSVQRTQGKTVGWK